ncbi:triphosphoribosyl-dephospho-CoA synthase MdcB [Verminephrobacter eiseniae]|uniref:triphosphoribosyl-dephospho-CoA synthase n=1 Tax=Verminephrobacter eiseniae TaxID=364317 RepID=UPI002237E9CB|nr:triphosphoribosyl-dephospho-CoA synthase [Verminephrobacter eiseniae]MCW5259056.1 triphosphoribosyl-dephospho-CoA synthase MdcB [Verminephrobacter eiseniae]
MTRPCAADPAQARPRQAQALRNLAVQALLGELRTYPKPGLVSLVDSGSHRDMDATTLVRSTLALRRYFEDCARVGACGAAFDTLKALGIAAEQRMLRATHGVNTHRGAIFHLGLLAAAAGHRAAQHAAAPAPSLGEIVRRRWGADIAAQRRPAAPDDNRPAALDDSRPAALHGSRPTAPDGNRPAAIDGASAAATCGNGAAPSHGSRACAKYGVGGAQAQAAAGFPSVYRVALPAYRAALARSAAPNQARVQAFFALLGHLDDTNLLHRGGREGLAYARVQAARFLADGGVFQARWQRRATDLHLAFRQRWLSPGGSADLLAVCLFVHAAEG